MVSPPSEPHSEKAHPNSPPQINLAFKAKGPDQDPGTTQPEGNSTHLTFFPRGGCESLAPPPLDPPMPDLPLLQAATFSFCCKNCS